MPHLSSHKKTIFYTYLLAIIALVTLPINTSSELNNITILQLRGDYFFHILMFLPWAFFRTAFTRPTQSNRPQLPSSPRITVIHSLPWFLLGILFASGTEGVQYFISWRAFNINDLLANVLGIILSFVIVKLIMKVIPPGQNANVEPTKAER